MSFKNDPISLIFLAYNESETIEKEIRLFYESIVQKLPGSEFIVAEDGSSDGTSQIIQRLVNDLGIIHLTSKERKGYTKALTEAVLFAKNKYIFFSDTGLKNDPNDFWKLYVLRDQYDLIVGHKTNRKDQWYRKLLTTSYNFYIRQLFGFSNVYDSDSGFRLFNNRVVEQIFKKGLLFKHLANSEVVLKTVLYKLHYKEVPISYFQRKGASRGLPLKKIPIIIYDAVKNLWYLRATEKVLLKKAEKNQ